MIFIKTQEFKDFLKDHPLFENHLSLIQLLRDKFYKGYCYFNDNNQTLAITLGDKVVFKLDVTSNINSSIK